MQPIPTQQGTDYKALVEHSSDGFLIVDEQNLVCYINPAAQELLGSTTQILINHRLDFTVPFGKITELKLQRPHEPEKLIEMHSCPIFWQNRAARMITLQDITEICKIERLKAEINERRRLAQLKEAFVSTLSHDLRNPLSVIKEAIDNLKDGIDGPLNSEQMHIAQIASRNVDQISNKITILRDESRLMTSDDGKHYERVDLSKMLSQVLQSFEVDATVRSVALEKDIPIDLPHVYMDSSLLLKVLTNLFNNAIRYAKNKIAIKVKTIQQNDELVVRVPLLEKSAGNTDQFEYLKSYPVINGFVQVSVIDDGPGITPELSKGLFQKAIKLSHRGEAGDENPGIGLAVCREVLERYDGKIWLENLPDLGAQFHFVLPLYRPGFEPQVQV